jgi:hypothetical protein
MTVVLTVMSGIDPHTISESQSCGLGQTVAVDSVVSSMSHFQLMRLLV